jgi:hypothetical protein
VADRMQKLKFPLQAQSLTFRIFRVEDYTIDDLVMHHSRVSITGRVLGTNEQLIPSRKLRDVLTGPAKV